MLLLAILTVPLSVRPLITRSMPFADARSSVPVNWTASKMLLPLETGPERARAAGRVDRAIERDAVLQHRAAHARHDLAADAAEDAVVQHQRAAVQADNVPLFVTAPLTVTRSCRRPVGTDGAVVGQGWRPPHRLAGR